MISPTENPTNVTSRVENNDSIEFVTMQMHKKNYGLNQLPIKAIKTNRILRKYAHIENRIPFVWQTSKLLNRFKYDTTVETKSHAITLLNTVRWITISIFSVWSYRGRKTKPLTINRSAHFVMGLFHRGEHSQKSTAQLQHCVARIHIAIKSRLCFSTILFALVFPVAKRALAIPKRFIMNETNVQKYWFVENRTCECYTGPQTIYTNSKKKKKILKNLICIYHNNRIVWINCIGINKRMVGWRCSASQHHFNDEISSPYTKPRLRK